MSSDMIDEVISAAFKDDSAVDKKRFKCEICGRPFPDNAHVKEHKFRMHSEKGVCALCSLMFVDKNTALAHQKTCFRMCAFPSCLYQTNTKVISRSMSEAITGCSGGFTHFSGLWNVGSSPIEL